MSTPQWENARQKGNRVRLERSELRRQVRAAHDTRTSRILVGRLLITDHPELETMRILDLLRWSWGMTEKLSVRLVHAIGATPFLTVGHLTDRQKILLARLLRADENALKDAEIDELARWAPKRPNA